MGLFNLGGVVGAFAKPKLKRIYLNDKLQGEIDTSTGRMGGYRSAMDASLADYEKGMAENIGEQKRLNKLSMGEIADDMQKAGTADYIADRERIRSGDLAALGGWMGDLGGTMSRADKLAASRLGYAGRPSSTYLDTARANRMAGFSAPIASQIFGGLNQGAALADNARGANLMRRAGLRSERGELPDRITDRMLQPAQARSWAYGDEIGKLGGLSDVNRSNFGGFKEEQNQWAQAIGAIDESLNSAVDIAASMYGMGGMGGGGGGGIMSMLGGGGGGGGGGNGGGQFGSVPADRFTPFNGGGWGGIAGMFGGGGMNRPSAGMGGLSPNQYAQAMQFRQQVDPRWDPSLYE